MTARASLGGVGWSRILLVAIAIPIALLAIAGLAVARQGQAAPYVGIGIDSATADPDGTVRIALDVSNATAASLRGTVSVTAQTTGGIRPLVRGSLDSLAGADGRTAIVVPKACGERLAITLDTTDRQLVLGVLVPCPAASRAAP